MAISIGSLVMPDASILLSNSVFEDTSGNTTTTSSPSLRTASPLFNGYAVTYKGAFLASAAAADGILVVHPIRNAAGDNFPIDLAAGDRPIGFEFDAIVEAGTTVDLTKTYIFPK